MDTYLRGLLDPFVTMLEVYKLLYFLQIAGEPLRLKFNKVLLGPNTKNLWHAMHMIEYHMVSGYAGHAPDGHINLIPGAIEDATAILQQHPETMARVERVADLISGFESAFGLELLVTVHWITQHEPCDSLDEIVTRVCMWKHKKQFTPRQIGIAVNTLKCKGWLTPSL